jgi:hypothetical protein
MAYSEKKRRAFVQKRLMGGTAALGCSVERGSTGFLLSSYVRAYRNTTCISPSPGTPAWLMLNTR